MRRRRAPAAAGALAAAVAVALGLGPAARAMDDGPAMPTVEIAYAAFATPQLDVVTGDTVMWMNTSVRVHDVVAGDGSFDSGRLVVDDSFMHRFDTAGSVAYYCSIHPNMTGEVDVHDLLLQRPAQFAGSGKPFVLAGRAATGITGTVSIEGDDGRGFAPVATAAVADDGTFRATVVPSTTTTYRAVADDRSSPPVQLLVLDHRVDVTVTRRGSTTTIGVRVTPADPGAPVVLQLRLRDRFGWFPVSARTLDGASTARFVLHRRAVVPARVLLTLDDQATELARSRTVRAGVLPGP